MPKGSQKGKGKSKTAIKAELAAAKREMKELRSTANILAPTGAVQPPQDHDQPSSPATPESPVRFSQAQIDEMVRLKKGGYIDPFPPAMRAQHPDKHVVIVRGDKIPTHKMTRAGFEVISEISKGTFAACYDSRVVESRDRLRAEGCREKAERRQIAANADRRVDLKITEGPMGVLPAEATGERFVPAEPVVSSSFAFPRNPISPTENIFRKAPPVPQAV